MATDNRTRMSLQERKIAGVIIVGAGVIGLSIARELARRGVGDIVVCDKGALGKEASWAAGGILAPQVEADRSDDFFKLATASRDLYPSFAQALRDETNIDVELDQTGTLYVAFTDDEEAELKQRLEWQQRAGLRVEWLHGADVRCIEPNVSSEVRCALRFPDDWQVENRKVVEALIAANEKLGVRLFPNCEVTSLRVDGDRVVGVETGNGRIDAARVIVCAGAWTSSLTTPTSSAPIEIEPVRGQMLCFKPAEQIPRHVIYSQRGYLVPRRDGRLLTGSTNEHVGFDKSVTDEGVNSIKSMALEIAPRLASEPIVDSWAGFRPRSLDDMPVLGPDADIVGLFYATGHFRNGILLAPLTAEVLANLFVGDASSSFIESFSPKRFCVVHT
jgi:glycine oxidase